MTTSTVQEVFQDDPVFSRDSLIRNADALTVSIIGGPGCGKTTLLNATVERLPSDLRVGIISADRAEIDETAHLSGPSGQVVHVNIPEGAQLNADHVRDARRTLQPYHPDLLFIETVGTLAIAHPPDLGQDLTAVIFSVAGGHDKARKHRDLVRAADVIILNKIDLLPYVPFDLEEFRADVRKANPDVGVFALCGLHGRGLNDWVSWLHSRTGAAVENNAHWFG
jgi:hydrogenase nickel incorporation protein HypB